MIFDLASNLGLGVADNLFKLSLVQLSRRVMAAVFPKDMLRGMPTMPTDGCWHWSVCQMPAAFRRSPLRMEPAITERSSCCAKVSRLDLRWLHGLLMFQKGCREVNVLRYALKIFKASAAITRYT